MKRTILSSLVLGPALLLAALLVPGAAAAAGPITSTACTGTGTVTCTLYAEAGTLALPGTSVPVWGFATTSGGSPTVPGPALVVNQGDTVTVDLTNHLSQPTSIVFGGQAMVPDLTGAAGGGGTATYTFVASAPGTYLYEAGLIPGSQYQVAMGMYGVLVVRPTGAAGQAYANASTAFDGEALVVLGEVDPALNTSLTPWTVDLRYFAPKYSLINGAAYPGTASIDASSGTKLLLRYANAGIQHHSIGVLGLRQSVLAADGSPIPYPRDMVAETIAPGQTADVLVSLPATTTPSTRYALYDASMTLNNSTASGIGGMLAFINAMPAGTSSGDTVGPVTSSVAINTGTGALTASVSDVSTGGSSVGGAEYFLDVIGTSGTGGSMTGTFPSDPAAVSASLTLPSGSHTIYVHGRDASANANWGAFSSTTYTMDSAGPTTSALVLTPNPSNGSVTVALSGTASDTTTGNSNVVAAEYWTGATGANGSGTPMTLNTTAPTVSLTATIPAPGSSRVVSVHSKDAAGNWGPFATVNLTVDSAGPATSGVIANPNPNNGALAFNSSNPSVRVTATFNDTASGGSTIAAGEGFMDTVGANGSGFPFTATDGVFNAVSEAGYVDIPLTTINALSQGNHTIYVHGKDSVGNWGANGTVTLLIDKTAPTFTGITLAPNPTNGAASVTLTVNGAADTGGAGVAGGEYWINPPTTTAPAPGSGTQFSGTTAAIPVGSLATGTYTVSARIRDAAGNWSTGTNGIRTATLTVVPDAIFSNGFEGGASPWGWSSTSTNSATRLTVGTPALQGTRSLLAQGNNTNYVQYDFGTAAQPATATYDARFSFNPNGNTGTNQDILVARTTGGATVFRVRYRMNAGQSQVQIQVGTSNANTLWVNLTNSASNRIEVVWQSGGTLQLYVGASATANQSLTATATSVGGVRLGSVTSGGSNTIEIFDAFASKRTTSPLFGP